MRHIKKSRTNGSDSSCPNENRPTDGGFENKGRRFCLPDSEDTSIKHMRRQKEVAAMLTDSIRHRYAVFELLKKVSH